MPTNQLVEVEVPLSTADNQCRGNVDHPGP